MRARSERSLDRLSSGRDLLVALVLCSCAESDPLHVVITCADCGQVESVQLDVVQPSRDESFSCDDVAYSEVDADAIALSRTQRLVLGFDPAVPSELEPLRRTGPKLFVAHGLDAEGAQLAGGCASLEEIGSSSGVDLALEPVVLLRQPDVPAFGEPVDKLTAQVDRLDGSPAAKVTARWTLASGSVRKRRHAETDALGRVELSPLQPERPGPATLYVRARWQVGPRVTLPWYREPRRLFEIPEVKPGDPIQVARVGPAGQVALAFLSPAQADGRRITIAWHDPARAPENVATLQTGPIETAVLGVSPESAGDTLYSATQATLVRIAPDGSFRRIPYSAPIDAGLPRQMVAIGSCERGAADAAFLLAFQGGQLLALNLAGQVVRTPFSEDAPAGAVPVASGCVAAVHAPEQLFRVVLYERTSAAGVVILAEMDRMRQLVWQVEPSSISLPPLGALPSLLAESRSVDHFSVAEHRLRVSADDSLVLELIAETPVPLRPIAPRFADVDGDGKRDVVFLARAGGARFEGNLALVVSLGAHYLGRPIVGWGRGPAERFVSGVRSRLAALDFDGDGLDDLFSGATIYAMGLPAEVTP